MVRKIKDLTGMRFGKLIAIKPTDKRLGGSVIWECLCDCGKTTYVSCTHLISEQSTSCGCNRQKDLSGKRFGNLLVNKSTDNRSVGGDVLWECICDCGNLRYVRSSKLSETGFVTSCGCKCSLYAIWSSMMHRCYNPNNKSFHRYGGRGINVCEAWHDIQNFYRDVGDQPIDKHSLGRIDNDKGYSPDNCRWETWEQQQNNRSTNKFFTYKGETKTVPQLAKMHNLNKQTVYDRIKRGWSIEKALLTPVDKRFSNKK